MQAAKATLICMCVSNALIIEKLDDNCRLFGKEGREKAGEEGGRGASERETERH
jgi:hypothetical protein